MKKPPNTSWEKQVVSPRKVIEMIEPGMSIFIGTGVGEPRTLVKHLMAADAANLRDLEYGVYHLEIPFSPEESSQHEKGIANHSKSSD